MRFEQAIRPNTKLLFGEIVGNPGLEVLDIPRVADVAHRHGLPLMVDATLVTPLLVSADRAGRGYCDAFGDEVFEWSWHCHWRRFD